MLTVVAVAQIVPIAAQVAPPASSQPSAAAGSPSPHLPESETTQPADDALHFVSTPWLAFRYEYSTMVHRYGAGVHWGALGTEPRTQVWWSVGPELLMSSRPGHAFQSLEGALRARVGALGLTGFGGSLEAAISTATDFDTTVPALSGGALLNLAYIEAGVLGQVPLAKRPVWMPALWLAVRVHVPLAVPLRL